MTRSLLLLLFMACSLPNFAQHMRPAYDSPLAKKLGADDYGMKAYVLAVLKPGPARPDSAQRMQLMQGHLKNIGRLAKEGRLLLAGPCLDKGPISGIFIFNVATVAEANKLVATDPAVKAGMFLVELHPWYGSAALMEIGSLHQQLQRKSITD